LVRMRIKESVFITNCLKAANDNRIIVIERHYPLRDNASLLLFRSGLGYGSTSSPIKPCQCAVFFCWGWLASNTLGAFAKAAIVCSTHQDITIVLRGYANIIKTR